MPRRSKYVEEYDRFFDPYDKRFYPRHYYPAVPKPYGCLGFLGDAFMFIITGGLWGIRIFVREMRRRNVSA